MRLNKFLAQAGLGSRRSVEKFICAGDVTVNGSRITSPGFQVSPEHDTVIFRGNRVQFQQFKSYVLLNKPRGVITTASDEHHRKTVLDLVHTPVKLYPVGRLDRDSEGLILLTNDGDLAFRLMHPRYKIKKIYRVHLDRSATRETAKQFRTGVVIDRRDRVSGELAFPAPGQGKSCLVTIAEGRNRQIRKMFAALGFRVRALQRMQIGPLRLGKLRPGEWRYLTARELIQLKKAVGITNGNKQ